MNLPTFIDAVDNLVVEWVKRTASAADEPRLPREQLRAIYDEVREQAVHDLAEAVRARDHATRTHGMLITVDQGWLEKEGKRLEAAKRKGEQP
jgi:hypothetical protein